MSDRIRVHTTTDSREAEVCVDVLAQQGILAEVESVLTDTTDSLGLPHATESHVVVASADAERARPLLSRALSLQDHDTHEIDVDISQLKGPITVRCERCGESTTFPGTMDGSTQECPKCFAFLDVGTLPEWNDWNVIDVEGEPEPTDEPQSEP